ncbi:hypothetical protein [uncultured Sphingomonas sp.]|uniref:hypothetical protein n=1 Tax=uncultured Sphingomonas sp. TaxID=158754 RepID=UPI0025EE5A97|nr:hypothetical protein [uncultured Sphingomonas sp.]
MIDLVDPVQRHIAAIAFRDAVVRDDASDMVSSADASSKQAQRQLRAMLPGVDFPWGSADGLLDDPVGRRVGRVAFNPAIRALWSDGVRTGGPPAPHRLPEHAAGIQRFIREQTHLGVDRLDDATGDDLIERLLGFSIADHAWVTDVLRQNRAETRLFVATSILAAACAKYEKKWTKTEATGRERTALSVAAAAVETALAGVARIAADRLLADDDIRAGTHRIAMLLANKVEAFRRVRSTKSVTSAVRLAASAADAVHLFLTRGTVQDIPLEYDRDPKRLPDRLAARNEAVKIAIQAMLDDVAAVDGHDVYVLLMARRLDVALTRYPWLAAPHPIFRLNYGYIGAHALFAECERLAAIIRTMADRQRLADGAVLDSVALRPVLANAASTGSALRHQAAAGRYLDLGVYHRAVTTSFMREKSRRMGGTVRDYTHHAYALGSRFCDLPAAATDASTHDFIRRSELDKPTQRGTKRHDLVLFYGLGIEDTIILALRQILDRLIMRGVSGDDWWIAFGRTVHRILSWVAPAMAARLEMTSSLKARHATCKGLRNRATDLARRFSDHDYDRPVGAFFDYSLWFDRDRDVAFWDRLQKGTKLYGAFGSTFVPPPTERETLPGRQGRRPTPANAPPSRWRQIMLEAKRALDAYLPLYVKSRPDGLTARIMARMSQGYSAFSSDPQFSTIFRT